MAENTETKTDLLDDLHIEQLQIRAILRALEKLPNDEARRRVLSYVSAKAAPKAE